MTGQSTRSLSHTDKREAVTAGGEIRGWRPYFAPSLQVRAKDTPPGGVLAHRIERAKERRVQGSRLRTIQARNRQI